MNRCEVCQYPVVDGSGLVVTTPSGLKMHGECVHRVSVYQAQGYNIREAIVLARRDARAEARRAP